MEGVCAPPAVPVQGGCGRRAEMVPASVELGGYAGKTLYVSETVSVCVYVCDTVCCMCSCV